MPTIPPQLEETTPTTAKTPPEPVREGEPLSFVPHDARGQMAPPRVTIRSARFGELDEHELVHLLDSIEDERARARFRESVYISLFVWIAIALVIFFGPKYLWHAPQLISPAEALLRQEKLTTLTNPVLPHHAAPAPKLDNGTLKKLREMTPKREPAPTAAPVPTPTPTPTPSPVPEARQPAPTPTAAPPLPSAPSPVPHSNATPVPDAPLPQPSAKPSFNTGKTDSDTMRDLARNPAPRGSGGGGISGNTRGNGRGAVAGVGGAEVLSDTQGVDFQPYLGRLMRQIYQAWIPLIPEEAQPPLNKQGVTQVRFKINPDGSLGGIWLDGPSGDVALDRAAWGSVNGQIFPPLPKQFTGPNLELRVHYLVNKDKE